MNAGTVYNLQLRDQQIIKNMSDLICRQDRTYFTSNYQRDKTMSLDELNINGFGAELAFCRLCNIDFDSMTNEKESHFTKADCTLTDGRTVDVKNTKYSSGKLIVRCGKEEKKVGIFVLMTGVFPIYTFRGWSTYEQIIQPENIINLGKGDAYCLTQSCLYLTL